MSPKDKDTYYPKYLVIRRSNCEVLDPTTCFTLVPSRDPHAVTAIKAYCDSCQDEMPGLAAALRAHFNLDMRERLGKRHEQESELYEQLT